MARFNELFSEAILSCGLPASDLDRVFNAFNKLIMLDAFVTSDQVAQFARRRVIESGKAMLEMSTPVTSIWDGILLLPLVGVVDSQRTQDIMDKSLSRIAETRARMFVMDISGVVTVDTAVANNFIRITQATRLMGCDCIISGISPNVARTLVELGANVGEVRTTATLRDALATRAGDDRADGAGGPDGRRVRHCERRRRSGRRTSWEKDVWSSPGCDRTLVATIEGPSMQGALRRPWSTPCPRRKRASGGQCRLRSLGLRDDGLDEFAALQRAVRMPSIGLACGRIVAGLRPGIVAYVVSSGVELGHLRSALDLESRWRRSVRTEHEREPEPDHEARSDPEDNSAIEFEPNGPGEVRYSDGG